jgi:amino acid adenylation domain-containing protein/non-ribosomal peptide synthase protein (TIGR01720 family)
MAIAEDWSEVKLDAAPLSLAQQRLWLEVSRDPADPAYHVPVALCLRGDLDRRALQQSLEFIVDRHEILRTTFTTRNGETLQVIHPDMPVVIRAAGRIPADDFDAEVRREIHRPFDLERGSLVRVVIYDLDDRKAVLLLVMHHLVTDGWSMGVLVHEFSACYRAFVTGGVPVLPELEIQYADFADWERERLEGLQKGQLNYWREQLRPPLSRTEILPDHPRPQVPSTRGATESFRLNILPDLRRLARSQGATLFMTLLAAFEVVLQRHTQADEVVVGSPIAGRNHPDVEPLIGFFVNTQVMRTDFKGDLTFAEALARVAQTTVAAYENQDIPFDRLVAELKPERRPGQRPFFDVMFALQNAPRAELELPGLTVEILTIATDAAKFDMTVICEETPDALDLRIEYCTDLYEASTVRGLAASFEQVLRAACADPDARIATIPLVTAAGLGELLEAGRRQTFLPPEEPTLHGWFARTAAQFPDRVAISWQGQEITYHALSGRAARIAGCLQAAGVRPGDRVALAMDRSIDLVAGILGILQAGAAYVPLDPAYPASRLAFMLADSRASAVLTHAVPGESLSRALTQAGPGVPVIRIENAGKPGAPGLAGVAVGPTEAAYVIYTSGSTGKPKGVVVTHENATGLFAATAATFGFGDSDVWTFFHSHAFDFSVWEIFGALLHGGRLVIVSHEVSRTPGAFYELLGREGVTFLNQTPSAFAQLDAADAGHYETGAPAGGLALRHIVFGGEALDPASLAGWFERHGDERPVLTNMYGITETTVHVTHRRIRAADAHRGKPSVIGRAIDDLSLRVLDEHLQPVPAGTPGELYVGGRGVTRGYLYRPGLTAARFVPDPFGADRLYRTGDRVRWGVGGGLEFLGRLDTQVKVRGFRIELGEIEHVLRAAGLREAVVVPRDDGDGTKLVAYGVPAVPGGPDPATLREACAEALPGHMAPAAYVLVDALPLTPNGKLDIAALPVPDFGRDTARETFVAPRTEIEKTIAGIWEDVLNVDRVGLYDNFFALGGDSIIMLQIAARASRARLSIGRRELIECQTVADLAARARPIPARPAKEKRGTGGAAIETPVPGGGVRDGASEVEDEYELTPLQEGLLFHGLYAPEDGHYIEQLHAGLEGQLDVPAFGRAWQTVIDRHPILRTSFHWRGVERPVQRVARRAKFTLELEDWRELAPSEQEERLTGMLTHDRSRGFDLGQAPLTRATLLRLGGRRWHLIWTHHHLVLDGWCLALVVGEVLAAYDAYVRGSEPVLPQRRPYRDFIDWLATQDRQAARDFWRERLAGFDNPNRLEALEHAPAGVPGGDAKTGGVGERDLVLTPEETEALQNWGRGRSVTLNTVISACWARLLGLYSRSDDVVFGVTVAGRPTELDGFEQMVGPFINTLPMRVRLPAEDSLDQWLQAIQTQMALMRAHEHARLVDIQRESDIRTGESLFETLLVFENYPVDPANLRQPAGLTLGPVTFVERTNYKLALAAIPGKSLTLRVYHDRARFDDTAVLRLLRDLGVLVRSTFAATARARPLLVGDWGTLTAADERHLIDSFGAASGAAEATWRSAPARVRAQARLTPDAIAGRQGADTLSYAELDRRAALLAARLRMAGVGAETIVGLCLARGLDFVVAILAVWRAGGAYLPIDPANPVARTALMLDDADPLVVIARPGAGAALGGRNVLELGDGWWQAPAAAECPPAELLPDQLAYVIYTSGSTGRPKGALLTHGGLSNLAVAQRQGFDVTPGSRVLQFASSSFDASVSEIAVTLCAGACLELAEPGELLHGPGLERVLSDRSITHVTLPPSALATLPETALPALQVVIVAGEACAPSLADRWGKNRRFVNAYGPTEVTVCATLGDQNRPAGLGTLDIGRPLRGVKVRVLDAAGRLVAPGVAGEIHVGGAGVGRGYLCRPGLTADRYRPDPYDSAAGSRVYATGDLARWREDGRIEFLGRIDRQIKLRGYRIETGEIEHVLIEHGQARDAIVQARVAPDGTTRLVAWVLSGADGSALTPAGLRAACGCRLPDYMLPAAYVIVPEWPRTTSGKVDLRALPDPDIARDTARKAYTAPDSDAEARLARIWGEVLGIERVGSEDDFFALGGDSILSLQIVSRALGEGLRISPRDLFEHPTVRGLAAVAGAAAVDDAETQAAPGDVPLTPIQQWFFKHELRHPDRWNQAIVLEVDPRVAANILERALQLAAAEHDAFRLRYARQDGRPTQRLAAPEECVDLLPCVVAAAPDGTPPATREALERWIGSLAEDAQAGLDLARGPLARAVIFPSPAEGVRSHLLVVAHHLVIDGVSWRILFEGVRQRLAEQIEGQAPQPVAASPNFAAWARRLSQYAATAPLPMDYWLSLGGTRARPLPVDREAPAAANTVGSLSEVEITLDAATTTALLRDVPGVYHTRAVEPLLAACAGALAEWSGDRRILLDLESHGREPLPDLEVDLSRTIGWFTSLYPVSLELPPDADPGATLCAVKEQVRSIPLGGMPFGLTLAFSTNQDLLRRLAQVPQPQVTFNYLGQLDQADGDPLLRLSSLPPGNGQHPNELRTHVLDIVAAVRHGELVASFQFSAALHDRRTIARLASGFERHLRALIGHCLRPGAGGHTPSDFPLSRIAAGALAALERDTGQIEDLYPLSPMQQGLLFHAISAPGRDLYLQQLHGELRGALDLGAFEQAWQQIVQLRPMFRGRFVWQGLNEPLFLVEPAARLRFDVLDWRAIGDDEQDERLIDLLLADRRRGLALDRAPLMRITVVQRRDLRWHWIWTHHHALLDGWCVGLVLREVLDAYESRQSGKPAEPVHRRPYRDYIAWLQRQDRSRAEGYWREALAGFTAPTRLSLLGSPACAAMDDAAAAGEAELCLSAAATEQLEAWARANRLTPNIVLTGAWARLLASYSCSDDVVFGVTVAGRPAELKGADRMIGLFINTLPQRVLLQPGQIVADWLRAIQQQQLALRELEYCHLVDIQRASELEPGTPLFETLIAFDNYPVDEALAEGFRQIEVLAPRIVERTHYPLTLAAVPGRQLRLRSLFDRRRVSDVEAKQILECVRYLLETVSTGQVATLDTWSLVPLPARLDPPQDAAAILPTDNLPKRFRRAAAAHADSIAVTCGTESLTYRELGERADRLAQHLREAGARTESLVGLYLDRTVDVAVGILGILEAGAAYVPIDPHAPAERIANMIADASLDLIVTHSALRDAIAPVAPATTDFIVLDQDAARLPGHKRTASGVEIPTASAAYVIYTSGSTGRPKGCVITHANVLRLFDSTEKTFAPAPDDVWTLFHSVGFDFSVWEIWGALLHGGRLVIVPHDVSRSPEKLHDLLQRERVTVLNQTPSAFRQLAAVDLARQRGDEPAPLSLRHIIFGGEALQFEQVRNWIDRRGDLQPCLTNMYGITETTVHVTERRIRRVDVESASASVIGEPIADLDLSVLDSLGLPLPHGAPGELHVAGAGVARGYLRRPGLTAERFLPAPGGGRVYRSGDLARRTAGDIEYLGRVDQQVKVRGFRIELGEIEAALLESPAVAMASVQAVTSESDAQQRLVAYVVPRQQTPVEALREHLATKLPDYMIPGFFVLLDDLPLTANGKVNRRALPPPDPAHQALATRFVEPRSDVERALAGAFAAALGLERVGIHDSFFALGGDSIRAIQVLSRARDAGLDLDFGDLFSHPAVADLAERCKAGAVAPGVLPRIEPFALVGPDVLGALPPGVQAAYPLTRLQQGMLLETLDAGATTTYHDIMSYHLRAPWNRQALEEALAVVVARHDILRTSILVGAGPELLQVVHAQATISLGVDDVTALADDAQERKIETWAREEAARPFDLDRAPLLRVQVHLRSAATLQFSLSLHHAILDGWSVATLLTELFTEYALRLGYAVPPLPAAPSSAFRDYVGLERRVLADEGERSFWRDYVAGARPTLLPRWPRAAQSELETPPPRSGLEMTPRRVESFEIPIAAGTSKRLEHLAIELGTPLRTVLLAAHVRALGVICGESDVVTGLVTNGRLEQQDGERVLGLFLGTLPIRIRAATGNSRELVKQVHEVEKQAEGHRRFPLAEIQRLAGRTLFETDFNFVNFHVLERVLRMHDDFQVLGGQGVEETGFTLAANFSLSVDTRLIAGRLDLDMSVVPAQQAARYPGIFGRALESLVEDSGEDARANLLDRSEYDELIALGSVRPGAAPACLHDLVGQQIARTPDAVAVIAGERVLTFAGLDRRANQLARVLLERGVRRDSVVGVCALPSCDQVVALLAVLRAGAAYLPLESEAPRERLAAMLSDAGVRVIVVDDSTAGVAWPAEAEIVPMQPSLFAGRPSTPPAVSVLPDNLAYVLFTSGSTGRPKGALITHRGIANHMEWMRRRYPLAPGDRVLQKTPVSFDASVWEFWAPLVEGASLVLAPNGSQQDPELLARIMRTERISILQLVPTLLSALVNEPGFARCSALRRLFVGGEPLSCDLGLRAREALPAIEVINLYGPTEATIDAIACSLRAEHLVAAIGRPIDGMRAFVADGSLRELAPVGLAPAGTDGDLYLGGTGLARGYAGQPGWTAASFPPDAFSAEEGARLYATGDRARWVTAAADTPALELEFRGRADDQVKLHGQRVELGEIEAALRSHPAVREAAAVLADHGPNQRLVAHIVAATEVEGVAALRAHLAERLPRALIPSAFVLHDALPRTGSGKIDRRGLAGAGVEIATMRHAHVAPANVVEHLLATTFAEVLGLERVGIHDDFYELGGDSILTLQIVSRLRQAGWRLSPRRILEHPTVARVAAYVEPLAGRDGVTRMRPAAGTVALAPIQRDYFARLDAIAETGLEPGRAAHWNQSMLLTMPPGVEAEAVRRAVHAVAAVHDATRLRFRRTPAGWEQRYVPADAPDGIAFEAVELSAATNWRAELALHIQQTQRGLDLDEGPVGRAVYFGRGARRGRLLLVLHHLIVDVVSWRILLADLATALTMAMAGEEIELPPPSDSYPDWVAALNRRARAADAGPWLAPSGVEARPLRSDRPDNLVRDAGTVRVRLDTPTTAALLRDGPARLRSRPEELLVAALFQSLSPTDEASSLWLDLEGHGREEITEAGSAGLDLSRTVGWFTALYPVCLQRSAGTRGAALLQAVKRSVRPFSARGADFGALRYLSPDDAVRAQLAALPRREVSFNFLGRLDAGWAEGASSMIGVAPEPIGHDHDPAGQRHYLLEVIARVSEGELVVDWIYPGKEFVQETVELWAADMMRTLKDLLTSDSAAAIAPSDFPLVQLIEDEIVAVLAAHPDAETLLPPSPLQEGLLFHALDDDQPGVYVQQITVALDGKVDRQAFEAAWDGVLRRHDALRASFHRSEHDGHAYSVVHRDLHCPVEWLDWADLDLMDVEDRWQRLLREDRARGFWLHRPPLMRLHVVRFGDSTWRVLWSHHHLLLDGWSLPLVLGDVIACYRAVIDGVPLPELPAGSYADYVAWQSGRDRTAARAHWRDLLRGFDTPSPMLLPSPAPALSPEAPIETHGEVAFTMPEAVTNALSAMARANHLTLSLIGQCWWAYLVARFSGRRDVVFGVTVAGRSAPLRSIETTAGLFINTLPMRIAVPAGCTLLEMAGRVHHASAALTEHEDIRLVDVQQLADIPHGAQLFDSILIFQNYPLGKTLADLPMADFVVRDVQAVERTHYPLACFITPGKQLHVKIVYDARRFSREGVERLLEHGRRALLVTAETPAKPLEAVHAFPRYELEHLVQATDGPDDDQEWVPLHERIARVAARDPDRTAVVCGANALSYGELAQRSSRLARALAGCGIVAEDRVGLYLERSVDMVVAMLGVLQSGAAYVPLDPRFPRARLELMLAESAARALVTQSKRAAGPPPGAGTGLLLVDLDDLAQCEISGARTPAVVHPESLAYVIHTSGSTGKPKGVQVPHGALCNVVKSFAAKPGLTREDAFVAVTTLSFDIAALELLLPLTVGARVIVAGAEEAADGVELGELIERECATVMQATPATWRMLVASGWKGAPGVSLWSGGEALPADLAEALLARGGSLWNLYGPTETTIWSKAGPVREARDAAVLGRPIAATSTYVVDSALELAPQQVPGELLIAGRGLARGHYGQPGLTAERFVPDAFGSSPGARAYRTGDEVRWTSGGFEFLGRLDQQLKIRGFRVELGEIETALRAVPGVADAVATMRVDRPGHPRLVAYVVPAGVADAHLREQLQAQLSAVLPGYMLPSAYVFLEALPLTPNGKTDRRALPAPGDTGSHQRTIVAPRNEIEEAIAGLWQDALGLERVGVTDSFFDLGGHSLVAASLLSMLHQAFRVKLPMRTLFAGPTVGQLASAICEIEEQPGRVQQIARTLLKIRGMSPEAKALMRRQRKSKVDQ